MSDVLHHLVRLDGTPLPAEAVDGKLLLIVNVASACGYTPQYDGLVALQDKYERKGFSVIGVPCNQFGGQEPGSPEEIATFCSSTYGVEFPLLEKQDVNGDDRSALYAWLINSAAGGGRDIRWNFGKFLVGRDGTVLARFEHKVAPEAPELIKLLEASL